LFRGGVYIQEAEQVFVGILNQADMYNPFAPKESGGKWGELLKSLRIKKAGWKYLKALKNRRGKRDK